MDLRKIHDILSIYLQLSEHDQKVLLNLLVPPQQSKETLQFKTSDTFLASEVAEKTKSFLRNPYRLSSYPPYVKKGDPFFPPCMY